jgi:purine nucleosidase
MSVKVLLDTDIGSDIDDAICLAYLLANPECDLAGITTVTGESVVRAMMASALCNVAGKKVPIYPGAEHPLLIRQNQTECPQAAVLQQWPHEKNFPQGQAVHFMRDMIRSNPGEIVLLAIGPMTNLGLLFALDPELPSLLKSLVLMCGVFGGGAGSMEWNAMGDPHATAIVYRYFPKIHRSVGLDVTSRVSLHKDEVARRFSGEVLKPVYDFAKVWFHHRDFITFHDPLAAATIFDSSICSFDRGHVSIELQSPRSTGMTYWDPHPEEGKHEVAFRVDPESFFNHYFSVF